MRSLFLLLCAALLAGFTATAQSVTGLVKDAAGKPLAGVTVSLLREAAVVKLAVSNNNGTYAFAAIPEGTYRVQATYVGFAAGTSAPFTLGTAPVTVPDLALSPAKAADMAAVTVQSRKPIVEVRADKMVVNVEGTINATGNDALELLRKSPGVLVDKDENLSVSGKNGVQVYIDGRPTPLSGTDLAQYLKTLQSTQIEAIEIISNPGARYEAAGNAGIINIRLKKNKNFGANGSVTAGYNIGELAKYNAGASLNYRNKNVNLFGNYNYNNSRNASRMNIYRSIGDTLFDQQGRNRFDNISHGFKVGADLTLSKQHSIGLLLNGSLATPEMNMSSSTPIIYRPTGAVTRVLRAGSMSDMQRDNLNGNLNYAFTGKEGRSLTVNADYGYFKNNTDQRQPNTYFAADGSTKINTVEYRMVSPTRIDISSLKADWEQNFAKGKLGVGGLSKFIRTDNDFLRYNVNGNAETLDRDRSNRFRYDETIHAGYVNYNRALKGMMIQAGLRVEHTETGGRSNGEVLDGGSYKPTASGFDRSYTDFFPSAAITFNKNPMKVWNLTYSRRIDRPAYADLNPFEFKLDEYTFSKGNTELRPQYTNSFGLTHTYKYKLNATLNYSHVADIFTQLIDTADRSKSFITKKNLATQDIVSLNVSYPFMYKNFTSFVNMNTNYAMYKADFGPGRTVDLAAAAFTLFVQNSLKFGKDKTWTGELTGFYNAPTVHQGTFRAKAMGAVDLGVQKTLFAGQATVKASVSDIFQTLRFRGSNSFAGQESQFQARWESRQFKLNMTWRFGNKQVKAAKQRNTIAEEEAKRTQGGGGGIGIGQ
ncbi:outer membrane beta-barrel family protein [Flaviaesturariibacter amylovorans]|uniref:Outer membrane beta-barrel family protein n=1 Tax=Flaviaesturariibacter amylovorans TaxID=1084520 RepID=A0ABP8G4J7_9BACT